MSVQSSNAEYAILMRFYQKLIDNLMLVREVDSIEVARAIEYIVCNHRQLSGGKTPQVLDYTSFSSCLGYVQKYAACHSALVRRAMLRILDSSPPDAVVKTFSSEDKLNVVCLGGGPGNDFVGLCSAIYGKHRFRDLTVTVIDAMTGWKDIFLASERVLRHEEMGNVSRLLKETNVNFSFLQADLKSSSSWNNEIPTKLKEADVLLLVKTLSVIPNEEKGLILTNAVLNMKPGALLIYIDCPFPGREFKKLKDYLDTVYKRWKRRFYFKHAVRRFECSNITASQAHVRVFVRKLVTEVSQKEN